MDLSFFKKIKYPIIFLTKLSKKIEENKEIINDEKLFYFIKFFFRFNHFNLIDLKIVSIFKSIKISHPKTYKFINSHDKLLNLTTTNFRDLLVYKDKVSKRFLNSNIDYQINFWEEKLKKLIAINDSTFGDGFIIKIILQSDENTYYVNEMVNRLILMKKLLGSNFFKKNKIILFTYFDFMNFDYQIKVKIFMKFYVKCKFILNEDITKLKNLKKSWNFLKYIYNN